METITVSELRCYRACPRQHHYKYVKRVRTLNDAAPLRFGKLMHSALELLLSKQDLALTVDCIRGSDSDPFDAAKAEAMILGYNARWGFDGFKVLAVEKQFTAPLVNPHTGRESRTWQLGGKIDLIVETPDKRVWLGEHKTSAEDIGIGSDYWSRLTLDQQVSVYYVGMRALGFEPSGCLYDVLRKPQQKPKQATPETERKYVKKTGELYANQRMSDETPDEYRDRIIASIAEDPDHYYQRGPVVRLDEDERDAAADVWQSARMIHEGALLGRAPRNPDACKPLGRSACPYLPVCTRTASIDDPGLYRVAEVAHEEMKEVA